MIVDEHLSKLSSWLLGLLKVEGSYWVPQVAVRRTGHVAELSACKIIELPGFLKCSLQNSTCYSNHVQHVHHAFKKEKLLFFGFSTFHSSLLTPESSCFPPERQPAKFPDVELMSSSIPVNGSWTNIVARLTLGSIVASMRQLVAPVMNVGYMFDTQ